ncbi:MAG: ubiquitin-like small modifier protein 1 [Candidatus Promineifilaceae bacterium]
MITVKLFGNLRDYTADSTIEAAGNTVREVLLGLCESNQGLYQAIFDGEALQPHVRVMIDGRDIELAAGLDTTVSASQRIAVFPPIAGG